MIKFDNTKIKLEHFKAEGFVNVDQVLELGDAQATEILSNVFTHYLYNYLGYPRELVESSAENKVSLIKENHDFDPDRYLFAIIKTPGDTLLSIIEVNLVESTIQIRHDIETVLDLCDNTPWELIYFSNFATEKMIELFYRVTARAGVPGPCFTYQDD